MRVAHSTISRLWGQAHGAHKESLIITQEIASQNNSHVNVLKYSHVEFQQSLKEIPQYCHKTYHSTVKALGGLIEYSATNVVAMKSCLAYLAELLEQDY